MTKIAKEAFIKLGLSEQDADKLLSTDESVTKDLKVDVMVQEVEAGMKKKFEDDGTMETYASSKVGKILSARDQNMMRVARERGIEITNDEYKALPEKDRTDALVKLIGDKFAEKIKSKGTPDDKDKEIEKLNAELLQTKDKVKQLEEVEIPKVKTENEKQLEAFKFNSHLTAEFSRVNAGKLLTKEDVVLPAVRQMFDSKYDYRFKDGQYELLEKGTDKVVYKDAKKVTLDMALDEISVSLDIRKKQEEPEKKKIEDKGQKKVSTPGFSRGQKAIEDMERERKANA